MKILSAAQIRNWDQATIEAEGITSLDLMERAAVACTDWLAANFDAETPFVIVCGTGNNGGDGLAITRLLRERGYAAIAMLVRHTDTLSPDCATNFEALPRVAWQTLEPGDLITSLPGQIVVIDALFGTGINRKVEGYVADLIQSLNKTGNRIISIDLPSGMPADAAPGEGAAIIKARDTLTFQQYKRAMLHPESGVYCGSLHVLDIGLDAAFAEASESHWHTLDQVNLRSIYKPREPFTHKGTHGTAYIVGGTYGMIGAISLATQAAGRAGAGKVRALVPECGYGIIQTLAPEAMCFTSGNRAIETIEGWESAKGIGIGPGLGSEPATVAAFEAFLKKINRPIVLDADALNLLGKHPEWLRGLPHHSILTPHPKELERMFGKTSDTYARAELVRSKAIEHELIIISKDRYTIIALPDGRCFYNTAGNAGLATGGSGDVLCGIVTGLLASGYTPENASLLGVYMHAAAGDAALLQSGSMEAMIAGDIVSNIGAAFRTLL